VSDLRPSQCLSYVRILVWTSTSHSGGSSRGHLSGMVTLFKMVMCSKSPNRPLQRDVIVAALEGDDVFVQAATGFGKSLCFQLPAIIDHGSMCNLKHGHSRGIN
jgi:hypothetical protein